MTTAAERLREAHKGFVKAAPASASRIAALHTFGLSFEQVDDFNVIVEGEYVLNIALSFWRALDGSSQGYLVSALDAEIRRNRKPAEGRDSGAGEETHRQTSAPALAESSAGTSSMALLPEVRP